MEVANIVRERTVIDQTVAIAQEKIKETREVAEADRAKQVTILQAEADAQEVLVKEVKAAEAAETAAKHRAVEMTTMADAELLAANKQAEAKKMLADGVRAERAAPGLADAQVREANAIAVEKVGVAEARVIEAKAQANYKQGSADAKVLAERLAAEAEGKAQMGRAQANSTQAMGDAEATSIGKRMAAEAEGLTSKFDAMDKMSIESRSHEEFRMALETGLKQAMASIEAGRQVSKENAGVLAEALRGANIELIGGDGGVFEALTKGVSLGKAIDGLAQHSPILQQLLSKVAGVDFSPALPSGKHDA